MAKTLQDTITWASPIIRFMPLTIGGNNEPAVTNANMVQQTIIGPPFCWAWNRKSMTFQTAAGTQDYTQSVPDFGFIEKASVTDAGGNTFEINVKNVLSLDSRSGRPDNIAAQIDDNAGNIVFRVLKNPDAVYTVTVTYQKGVSLLQSLGDRWTVPDDFQFICNYGFLALALLHLDDPRVTTYNQKFMSSLLSTSRGLTDTEKNIFVGNWLALTGQEMSDAAKTQQGNAARGV